MCSMPLATGVQVTNKLGGIISNVYDKRGLLLSETLPMSSVHSDGIQQAASVTNSFEYDSRGNRTKMIEAAGPDGAAHHNLCL